MRPRAEAGARRRGRARPHRAQRARSTRARRARPAGGSPRPAVAGGRRLGPLFCGRRAPAPTRDRRLRLIEPDRRLHHRDPVGADRAWRPGRQTRRRARSACGRSRRPLGGDRDGRDRRRRRPGRNGGVATSQGGLQPPQRPQRVEDHGEVDPPGPAFSRLCWRSAPCCTPPVTRRSQGRVVERSRLPWCHAT